jgi:hypothetical protein
VEDSSLWVANDEGLGVIPGECPKNNCDIQLTSHLVGPMRTDTLSPGHSVDATFQLLSGGLRAVPATPTGGLNGLNL